MFYDWCEKWGVVDKYYDWYEKWGVVGKYYDWYEKWGVVGKYYDWYEKNIPLYLMITWTIFSPMIKV